MTLEGKVANVLNDRELVINLGKSQGVEEGMVFEVSGQSLEVRDPDTNAVLGEVEPSKVKVKVIQLHDKFAVARTFETYTVELDEPLPGYPFSAMRPTRRVTRVKKLLPFSIAHISAGYPRFTEEGAYVMAGDKVRLFEEKVDIQIGNIELR
jgi:hypothetical protein